MKEAKFCNSVLINSAGIHPNASFSIIDGRFATITTGGNTGHNLNGQIVIPGFIDSHIHGFQGYDFEDPACDFESASQELKRTGTTSFLATISPFTPNGELKIPYHTLSCPGLEGFHLEGPYINQQCKGGFYDGQIRPYDANELEGILSNFSGNIKVITAAPECVDLVSLLALSQKYGFYLSAGHTQANFEIAVSAFQSGFSRVTHLFNAMRELNHRSPGVLDPALLSNKVYCEIIADLHHLSLQMLQLILRIKPFDMLIAVTDCICPHYPDITVRNRMAYRGDTIYGSLNTMYDIFLVLIKTLGLPLNEAIKLTSINPAKSLNLDCGDISVGMRANFIILNSDYSINRVYTYSDFVASRS